MIKNYVIDTNVLLLDPNAIFNFEDNNVIIPIGVIEELDKFKKDMTELGRNARETSRSLDKLRAKGNLKDGVKVGEGTVKVCYNGNLKSYYKESNVDLHVIHIAQERIKTEPDIPCVIVSRDINVRIRADALGLNAETYESDKISHTDIDKGFSEIVVPSDAFDEFAKNKKIQKKELTKDDIPANHYLIIKCDASEKKSLLGRVNSCPDIVRRLIPSGSKLSIVPKNKEQEFVIDALLDNSIKLVSIVGKAGCGKTLLSIAVGYYLTVVEKKYKRLLVSRPIFPMGRDLGYLPGTIDEKLDPWMHPIYDAFDILNKDEGKKGKDMIDGKTIVVEPLTYIRGRSIHDQFLIVDEAQNLTPLEIKTIITRAGEGTKVVLTGDVHQIDNPYIDSLSNGLSIVMASMRGSILAASIVMEKGVRSALAEEAANKL